MKPYELIAALMHQEGGSLPLARKMGKLKMQATIYKFAHGHVASPTRPTAEALAAYFKLPVDAIYNEKLATAIAKERGISGLPAAVAVAKPKAPSRAKQFDADTQRFAELYQKLKPGERQKLRLLINVARDGIDPIKIKKAPRDASTAIDRHLGGDSGLGDLDSLGGPSSKSGKRGAK